MCQERMKEGRGQGGGAGGEAAPSPSHSLWCATWLPLPAGTAARTSAGHGAPPGPSGGRPQDGARQSSAAPRPPAVSAPVAGTAVVSVNLLFL